MSDGAHADVSATGADHAAAVAEPDLSEFLARTTAGLDYDDLPEPVVRTAKAAILDTIGVCLAATGQGSDYVPPVRGFVEKFAAAGDSPGLGLGRRIQPLDSIFWLGSLAHALDFDDVAGYSHPSAPVVTAALPLSHHIAPVDGRRLIEAVALGQDMVIRLSQALQHPLSQYGWMPSMPGTMGAALACAKLLRLDVEGIRNALGLALHQTSGTMQALARPGSAYRAVREAFNARAGALAALLAADGLPGDHESIEGQFGFFAQFFGNDYDRDFAYSPELLGPRIAFKLWPCAGHPTLFLTVLAEMLADGTVRPEHVSRITVTGCSDLLPHQCEPPAERAAPRHGIDAKVSIPFLIGKLLKNRTIDLDDFSPAGLDDPAAIALGQRVSWHSDPSLARGQNGFGVGIVEIEHSDGSVVRAQSETPIGHPDNPLSWDQLVTKFRRCLDASAIDVPRSAVDEVVTMIDELESAPDVGTILETLFQRESAAGGDRPGKTDR
jgi:2-methylcitrate dehydratase PrpD